MNPILRNVIAVIVGIISGMVVNMSIVSISGSVIPIPEGIDPNDMESLKENIHLFKPINYLMPFLAHALGTFFGALVAGFIAASHKMRIALGIGVFFLAGGIASAFMLPASIWFIVIDIVGAYIPMGWLAGKITTRNQD